MVSMFTKPPSAHVEVLAHSVARFGDMAFREAAKLNETHKGGALSQ